MNTIIRFQTRKEFNEYLKINGVGTIILGSGFEGICYKSTRDKYAYKVLQGEHFFCSTPDITDIITTSTIDLKSFALPIQLFTLKDEVIGHKSKRLEQDLFSPDTISNIQNIERINFDKLIKACFYMIKDIEKLSEKNILIDRLESELLFDGTSLLGIDTYGYSQKDSPVLEKNIKAFIVALVRVFEIWTNTTTDKSDIQTLDIEKYLKDIKQEYTVKRKFMIYK